MMEYLFTDAAKLTDFIKAGKAIITLKSRATGKHFTYRIKEGDYGHYISRLTSGNDWAYLGVIDDHGFRFTKKTSPYERVHEAFDVFLWFWTRLNVRGDIHPMLDVYHEGMCGACGTRLTSPASIEAGYGPECLNRRQATPGTTLQ